MVQLKMNMMFLALTIILSLTSIEGFNLGASRSRLMMVKPAVLSEKGAIMKMGMTDRYHGAHPSSLRNKDTALYAATASPPIIKEEPEKIGKTFKKIIPLGAMLFFILFNYTILRDTKDVLVVTAPGGGAEMIPFLVRTQTNHFN